MLAFTSIILIIIKASLVYAMEIVNLSFSIFIHSTAGPHKKNKF